MSVAVPGAAPLLERETELRRLDQTLVDAAGGRGAAVLVEASAGIGKTRLLQAAAEQAERRGFRILRARATELEREFPFGVVRQLFEPVIRAAAASEREALLADAAGIAAPLFRSALAASAEAVEPGYPTLHGLYWLLANLADPAPVLLLVDDAHSIDGASLRYLEFIAVRLGELHAAAIVALRPEQRRIDLGEEAQIIRPGPLSEAGVRDLLAAELGQTPHAEFAAACHRAVGGNPFYLSQLLTEVRRRGTRPDSAGAAQVADLGPAAVARAVLARIAASDDALALARALSVLGDGSAPAQVAELADLRLDQASDAADSLVRADVLVRPNGLAFVHPIVRNAVHEDIAPRLRTDLHRRAARVLAGHEAPPERVAAELLATDGLGDRWVVESLRGAAQDALARGAPDAAAAYLERAVGEPPSPALRPEVLHDLAAAEALARSPEAVTHLRAALEAAEAPASRAQIALALAFELGVQGKAVEAVQMLDDAIGALGDGDRSLWLELEAMLAGVARNEMETHERSRERLFRLEPEVASDGPAERLVLANLAFTEAIVGGTAERAAGLAQRALADGRLLDEQGSDSMPLYFAINTLWMTEHLDEAERHLGAALDDAQRRGSSLGFGIASCFRGELQIRRGLVLEAEADLRAAIDALSEQDVGLLMGAWASLSQALVERGELAEADAVLAFLPPVAKVPPPFPFSWAMEARGRLRLAQGRPAEALEDLTECGRRNDAWGMVTPALINWREPTALAHLALGDDKRAAELAAEAVEHGRRFRAPRALGVSLTTAGLVAGGDEGTDLLVEAVEVLESADAPLERARACVELGAALRRAGRRSDARDPLRTGLELAATCGALALQERARTELAATGARPRRDFVTGVKSLTASERRVAEMAASGMTNRQIAQALFVTVKTVEVHLSRVYAKLDIRSRSELGSVLD